MPTNPEQIHAALQAIGRTVEAEAAADQSTRTSALQLLQEHASDLGVAQRVETIAARHDPNLRCGLPLSEPIVASFAPGVAAMHQTIIAVDGSQILPDRHAELLFGVINIGRVMLRTNSGVAPDVQAETTILFGETLRPNGGPPLTEGEIALARDKSERASLLRYLPDAATKPTALVDGPLELWGPKDLPDPNAFKAALSAYLEHLREMHRMGWTLAGYVDKPGADLVIRLFEVLEAPPEALTRLRGYRPLRRVSDRWLFGGLLPANHRSAVFAMQSQSKGAYAGDLAICFFYLNVGTKEQPAIARVEIPKWVATDGNALTSLHATLIDQCRVLGARPYPYLLHRAHETARISSSEHEELKLRLMLLMRQHGAEPERPSAKSFAKQQSEVRGSF